MGGPSEEREVSLRSGDAVVRALAESGTEVTPIDVRSEDGDDLNRLRCDVAFLALHGRFGEDGTIQRILDRKGIPYTGSDADASALAMDKVDSKRRFRFLGVETPQHRVIGHGDGQDLLEQSARSLGYPVVIKPRAQGSSLGVTLHADWSTLRDGAAEAFRYGPVALMEKMVEGREMTVGILEGKPLPILEIRPNRTFFDYRAKYEDEDTRYLSNPSLSEVDTHRISKVALEAYEALNCEGFARVDLIFRRLHSLAVLEVNTIPGLTPRSLFPKAAAAAGIEFPDLCRRLVSCALRKKRRLGWSAAIV